MEANRAGCSAAGLADRSALQSANPSAQPLEAAPKFDQAAAHSATAGTGLCYSSTDLGRSSAHLDETGADLDQSPTDVDKSAAQLGRSAANVDERCAN